MQPPSLSLRSDVLLRSEDTSGSVSLVEIIVPAGSAGPPLHRHDFDEVFYVLQGELVFCVGDALMTRTAGQLAFARPGGTRVGQSRLDFGAVPAGVHPSRLRASLRSAGRAHGRRRAVALGPAAGPGGRAARTAHLREILDREVR